MNPIKRVAIFPFMWLTAQVANELNKAILKRYIAATTWRNDD